MQRESETKTLNGRLFEEGFNALRVIPNKELSRNLSDILVDFSMGKYKDLRIIPSEVALDGSDWDFEEKSHIIYAKENKEHPNYKPDSIKSVKFMMINRKIKAYDQIFLQSI